MVAASSLGANLVSVAVFVSIPSDKISLFPKSGLRRDRQLDIFGGGHKKKGLKIELCELKVYYIISQQKIQEFYEMSGHQIQLLMSVSIQSLHLQSFIFSKL